MPARRKLPPLHPFQKGDELRVSYAHRGCTITVQGPYSPTSSKEIIRIGGIGFAVANFTIEKVS